MNRVQNIDCPVIVLVGPTAIGKTALSLQLIKRFPCEIVSMDSMQVYRYMNIGTAKPDAQEQALVPHHLIDIINPDEQYNAARFVQDALKAIKSIASRNRVVLLTGGTGLYLKALIEGLFATLPTDEKIRKNLLHRLETEGREKLHAELCSVDPISGAKIHINDTQRLMRGLEIYLASGSTWSQLLKQQKREGQGVNFTNIYQIGLACHREQLYKRIEQRSKIMIQSGLLEEVLHLRNLGYKESLPSMQSIGYRHANNLLSGVYNKEQMVLELIRDTRRYAKRQMTWFSRNRQLHWFDRNKADQVADKVALYLQI